jgi:epoxyqueuosine reductase
MGIVRDKLLKRRDEGVINGEFFEENLTGFTYLEDCTIKGPKAVIIVAVPRPIHILPLTLGGKRIEGLIPPTYVNYRRLFEDVLGDIKKNVIRDYTGVEIEILKAPLKSLAVHMGLASYGRNNITYVADLGSSYQLCGYIVGPGEHLLSDASDEKTKAGNLEEEVFKETMMERCRSCKACLEVCPTGAIRADRFLISAEMCFTLHSESSRPIPEWIKPPATTCVIGCMACQEICPENKGRLRFEPAGIEFTAEETKAVLAAGLKRGAFKEGAWSSAQAKFASLGMSEPLEIVGRNLRYLFYEFAF